MRNEANPHTTGNTQTFFSFFAKGSFTKKRNLLFRVNTQKKEKVSEVDIS